MGAVCLKTEPPPAILRVPSVSRKFQLPVLNLLATRAVATYGFCNTVGCDISNTEVLVNISLFLIKYILSPKKNKKKKGDLPLWKHKIPIHD